MKLPILRILLRTFRKNPQAGIIQLLGLGLGLASFLMLYLFYDYETSYNRHLDAPDNLYRVSTRFSNDGDYGYNLGVSFPLAEAIRTEVTGPSDVTLINAQQGFLVRWKDTKVRTDYVAFIDSSFGKVFGHYKFLAGNKQTAFDDPNGVVLAEDFARKLFSLGPDAPIGTVLDENILMENKISLRVVGVVADEPPTSDFAFDAISQMHNVDTLYSWNYRQWQSTSSNTQVYARLLPGVGVEKVQSQMQAIIKKHHNSTPTRFREYIWQPILETHYLTDYGTLSGRVMDPNILYALMVVGVLTLISAIINFVNIGVAQSSLRAREVGVRKVVGSSQGSLIGRFISEGLIIVSIAFLLGLLITELALPWLNSTFEIEVSARQLLKPINLGVLAGLVVITTLLANLYPAWLASRFNPSVVLKGKAMNLKVGGVSVRKGLVFLQFAISQVFLVGALMINQQTQYMLSRPVGYNRDAIVILPVPDAEPKAMDAMRARMAQVPGVEAAALCLDMPQSGNHWQNNYTFDTPNGEQDHVVEDKYVDSNYMQVFGLELIAGQGFNVADTNDQIIVNETFIRQFALKSPEASLGLVSKNNRQRIVGVMKDFHQSSLHTVVLPTALIYAPNSPNLGRIAIKLKGDVPATLATLKKAWEEVWPNYLYDFEFADDSVANLYEADRRTAKMLTAFTGIALVLAAIGLYGLVYILISQRLREVSIRKVLGAGTGSLIRVFSKEFVWVLLLANLLAWPLAWWALRGYLEQYEYRIDQNLMVYLGAGVIALVVSMLTISLLVARTARVNPATVLRSE